MQTRLAAEAAPAFTAAVHEGDGGNPLLLHELLPRSSWRGSSRRTGARGACARRGPARRGVDALTPSDGRVARMVADGQTNREIAQALFVAAGTVETHLSSVYRKLDIQVRSQLAQALG